VESKISKDEALERAIKVSARPQPLFLDSKINGKDTLALTLISNGKTYLHADLLSNYFQSILIHETTEIEQNESTLFKELALTCDLAHLIGKEVAVIRTHNAEFDLSSYPSLKKTLDESMWLSYSDAGAIYVQLNSPYTPPDFTIYIIDELSVHNKEVLNIYLEIDEIIEKFRKKYRSNDDSDWASRYFEDKIRKREELKSAKLPQIQTIDDFLIFCRPLEVYIKDIVLRFVLGTVKPETIDKRLNLVKDLSENEIPEWSLSKVQTLVEWLGAKFIEEELDITFLLGLPFYSLYFLSSFIYLSKELPSEIVREHIIGTCKDLYFVFLEEPKALPITVYLSPNLKKLENSRLLYCIPPTTKIEVRNFRAKWNDSCEQLAKLANGYGSLNGLARRFITELMIQSIIVTEMEVARHRSLIKCINCPHYRVEGPWKKKYMNACLFQQERRPMNYCGMLNRFPIEFQRQLTAFYKQFRKLEFLQYFKNGDCLKFDLPLFRNIPQLSVKA
jgi:hypothetical protein